MGSVWVARQAPSRGGRPVPEGATEPAEVKGSSQRVVSLRRRGAISSQRSRGVMMGTSPFIKSPFARHGEANRRRSTRIEFVIPIILSGRDAKGEAFRETTQTETVNLHGARMKIRHAILVGMQVSIENPQTGASEKAVCVRIEEDVTGESAYHIAVQLVRPGNIWGVAEPPSDWAVVAANTLGSAAGSMPRKVQEPASAPAGAAAAPLIESQVVTWEQQSAELVESALQILRRQIETLLSAALKEFENRLQLLEKETGKRLELRSGKTLAEVSTLIQGMREEIVGQITAQGKLVVTAAERDLRAKVAEILSPLVEVGAGLPPAKPVVTFPRK
jgi:hypothetical protein